MTELAPTLFQLDQIISIEQSFTACQLTSCGRLGVGIVKNGSSFSLIALTPSPDELKTHWISWFSDPLMNPQTLCFSSQNDLLLIATCSGILSVVPTKLLLTLQDNSGIHGSKKVRVVRAKEEAEIARRAMPVSICWWATNESKALAIVGTNHGLVIIIDLVDGKEIGHVKISEKAVTKLEQVTNDSADQIYLFITDSSGKQWRQLLEQKSTGFTWCGANEAASHPKTPTLEKAANASNQLNDRIRSPDFSPPNANMAEEEEFTTRSRLQGLKQMSVASIASLRQRLSVSRKIFDRTFQHGQNGSNSLSVPISTESQLMPESLAPKVGDTQIQIQTNTKGQKVICGLSRDTAILTMHNYELEVLPQVAFKLPKQTDSVLMLDKLMLVKVGKNGLKIVSAHHAEITLDKAKDDPVLQTFTLPNDELIIGLHLLKTSSKEEVSSSSNSSKSSPSASSPAASEAKSGFTIPDPCDKLSEEVKMKVNAAHARGLNMFQPCLILTSKGVYVLKLDEDPVSAFLDLATHGQTKQSEKIAACFELDAKSLLELAADIKLTKNDFPGAIGLYRHSGCKHLKAVLKFAASGHVQELLSYLNVLFKTVNLEVTNGDRIHLANLALMAYFQQVLATEASFVDDLRSQLKAFLDSNQWFEECLAVRLAAETREWTLLSHLATSRGLQADMLMAISAAFGQLSALETDNVKHLQEAMTKVLQEMPRSERKGLVQCLVYQIDNLATCMAFANLGEQIVRILIGLLPLLEEPDLLAVIEQCRPDRPDLLPILWPLAFNQDSDLGLMLINFYLTVQLMYNKKQNFVCDSSLVKTLNLVKNESHHHQLPITKMPTQLGSLVRIRTKASLMATGVFHVLLIRPKSGQLLSWGSSQASVLGHSSPISRYASPKPVELFQNIKVLSVAAGRAHSMALTDCGLYVWGSSKHGQLGLGPSIFMAKRPTMVKALAKSKLVGISAGNYHSAAWDETGKAWTWGWGVHGQLGQGTILDEFRPCRLTFVPDRILSIECGYAHTLVLTIKAQVWSFGCGLFGQLGMGELKKATLPSRIVDLENIGHISCGHFHNLAFDSKGQKLYIWGCNPQVLRLEAQQKRKQLAEAAAACSDKPEASSGDLEASSPEKKEDEIVHLRPKLVDTSLFRVAQVAAGNQHSLILTFEGSVLAFGRNLDGQLGIGSRKEAKLPTLVSGLKDDMIVEVAAAGDFSLAMADTGSVFAWGNNTGGQLGKAPLEDANAAKDGLNSKIVVMKSTKRMIRLQHSLQNSCDVPKPVVGITSGVYSSEATKHSENLDRVLDSFNSRNARSNFFCLFEPLQPDDHRQRLHFTLEAFAKNLDKRKVIKKCLVSDNPQAASKVALLCGNVLQAFDFSLQAFVKGGFGAVEIFEAFIYYLHYKPTSGGGDTEQDVKRQLLERLIACWQDQKFSFVQLENLFIQNFDAILLQILVLTLFCPSEERAVDDGPVLNNEALGRPKLVDLFTPEFCLRVGDTFVTSIQSEDSASSQAVNRWLQKQRGADPKTPSSNSEEPDALTRWVTEMI